MLDEKALRRPEFAPDSVPIRLADGQEWHFPKPWVVFFPKLEGGQFLGLGGATTFGAEFDQLKERAAKLRDEQEGSWYYDLITTLIQLGVFLLSRNYALADEDYAAILRYDDRDGSGQDMLKTIWEVAAGIGPKPSPDGSGSAP